MPDPTTIEQPMINCKDCKYWVNAPAHGSLWGRCDEIWLIAINAESGGNEDVAVRVF